MCPHHQPLWKKILQNVVLVVLPVRGVAVGRPAAVVQLGDLGVDSDQVCHSCYQALSLADIPIDPMHHNCFQVLSLVDIPTVVGVVAGRSQAVGNVAASGLAAAHIGVLVVHQEVVGSVAAVAVAKVEQRTAESRIDSLAGAHSIVADPAVAVGVGGLLRSLISRGSTSEVLKMCSRTVSAFLGWSCLPSVYIPVSCCTRLTGIVVPAGWW